MNKALTIILLVGIGIGTTEAVKIGTTEDFFSDIENTQIIGEKTFNNVIKTVTAVTDTIQQVYKTTTEVVGPVVEAVAVLFDKTLLPMIQGTAVLINYALEQISKLNNKIKDLDIIIPLPIPVNPIIPAPPIYPPIPPITI